MHQLYNSSFKLDRIDLPDTPSPSVLANFTVPDLRRTINYLQFQCSSASSEQKYTDKWEPQVDSLRDLYDWGWDIARHGKLPDRFSGDQDKNGTEVPPTRGAGSHAELISFVDCHLMRSPWDTPEVGCIWTNGTDEC